jgi:hypothetical protein
MSWVYLYYSGRKLYLKSWEVSEKVLAFWRSGGSGIYRIIIPDTVAEEFKRKYGRYGSIEVTSVDKTNLLKLLKKITDFEWVEYKGVIYISAMRDYNACFNGRTTSNVGWWIGKGGWRVREIQRILERRVIVVDCLSVHLDRGYYVHTTGDGLPIVLSFDNPDKPDKTWRGLHTYRYCFALWRLRKVRGVINEDGGVTFSDEAVKHIREDLKDVPFMRVNDDGVVEVLNG